MPDKHAILSASGSHRWLECTPSAMLEARVQDVGSPYAMEGTIAHEIAAAFLEGKPVSNLILGDSDVYSPTMLDHAEDYRDFVQEQLAEARKDDAMATLLVERRLDFSDYVPEGFGTGDAVIVSDGMLRVIDYKYGQGVKVEAHGNSQMRLYALGALSEFGCLYNVEKVSTTIFQPRLGWIDTEILTTDELLAWGQTVKEIAAVAAKGEGDRKAGAHCKFCKVADRCPVLAAYQLETVAKAFDEPEELTDSEIAEIVLRKKDFEGWLKRICDYALDQAVNHGAAFPGMKLVAGTSRRAIAKPAALVKYCVDHQLAEEDRLYKPRELITLGELEKLIGAKKVAKELGEFIEKPEGKPTLVSVKDKRPEWSKEKSIIDQFEEE